VSADEPTPAARREDLGILWGDRLPPRRGPKPTLSIERIVAAGIEVADAEGAAALTMSRVAKHLGSPLMSLYRYVPSRAQLVEVMLDTVVGDPPDLDAAEGWRRKLELWADATERVFHAHPWALSLVTIRRTIGPNELAWVEAALAAVTGTGLGESEKLEVVLLVNAYVRGHAQAAIDSAESDQTTRTGPAEQDRSRVYAAIIGHEDVRKRYPMVARQLESGRFEGRDPGFGLERVLDGVQCFVDERTQPRTGEGTAL
jgi:AcrR family transcriptional regulator